MHGSNRTIRSRLARDVQARRVADAAFPVFRRECEPAWNLPSCRGMGIILAAFFFGMITLGFTLLTVMPLVLVWLMVGVHLEGKARTAPSTSVAGEEAPAPGEHFLGAGRGFAGGLQQLQPPRRLTGGIAEEVL